MNKRLIFTLVVCFCGQVVAFAQPRGASEPQLLIKHSSGLMAPVWSPSGDKIAVTTDNYTGILVANADGSNLHEITDLAGAGYKMQWNSDGTRILGRTNVVSDNRIFHEIKVWNVATGEEQTVMEKTRDLTGTPIWENSSDNISLPAKKAILVDMKKGIRSTKTEQSAYEIMVSDPAKAADKIASLGEFSGKIIINPALSADGTMVAFQIPGKGIYTCAADGSGVEYLCKGSHPVWLPDNSIIYTLVKDNGSYFTASDIYAVNPTTKKSVLLTGNTDVIPLTPSVSADGTKVAFENAKDAAIYVITLKY